MKISEILKCKRTLSFEVFPPKRNDEDVNKLYKTIDELKKYSPDFISVTYGANGSNNKNTTLIASHLESVGITALAHMTCICQSGDEIDSIADELKTCGVENILALRGDIPVDGEYCGELKHASDLAKRLSLRGDFNIGCAAYPEGHTESKTLYEDLEWMKYKEECGADFFITQLFYDNNYYYRLVSEARKIGIKSPIIPGIMPITSVNTINKVKELCGATIPLQLRNMLEVYRDNPKILKEIGYNYAANQIAELIAMGAPGVHLYIMNSINSADEIYMRLSNVFRSLFKA